MPLTFGAWVCTMKLISLIALTLLIGALSCSKTTPTDPSVYVDSTFKSQYNFKKGTYWVYYDSVTTRLDSFILINNSVFQPYPNGPLQSIYHLIREYRGKSDTAIYFWDYILEAPATYKVRARLYGSIPRIYPVISGLPVTTGTIDQYNSCSKLSSYANGIYVWHPVYQRDNTGNDNNLLQFFITPNVGIVAANWHNVFKMPERKLRLVRWHIEQ